MAIKINNTTVIDDSRNLTAVTGTLTGDLTLSTVPFFNNCQTVASNYTIGATDNAMTIGPITINSGITVTVSTGGKWAII